MKKTVGLMVLCVFSGLIFWSLDYRWGDAELLSGLLLFSGESFFQGRFWVAFTALFIHADLAHLLGNMIFLYVFGSNLEDEVEAGKTLAAFFAGGVLSFVLSAFLYGPRTVSFGASAAIFTLTAIVMLTKPLKLLGFPHALVFGGASVLRLQRDSGPVYWQRWERRLLGAHYRLCHWISLRGSLDT